MTTIDFASTRKASSQTVQQAGKETQEQAMHGAHWMVVCYHARGVLGPLGWSGSGEPPRGEPSGPSRPRMGGSAPPAPPASRPVLASTETTDGVTAAESSWGVPGM